MRDATPNLAVKRLAYGQPLTFYVEGQLILAPNSGSWPIAAPPQHPPPLESTPHRRKALHSLGVPHAKAGAWAERVPLNLIEIILAQGSPSATPCP